MGLRAQRGGVPAQGRGQDLSRQSPRAEGPGQPGPFRLRAQGSDPDDRAAAGSRAPHPLALYAAFAGCALVWGSTFLAISFGNDAVPPLWAATVRLAFATPLLFLIARLWRQPLPRGAALRAAAGYGVCSFGAGFSLLYWAETEAPSGLASVFYATIPLTSTLLTRAFGLESLTFLKVGAAAIAFAGVGVIFSGQFHADLSVWPLVALTGAATAAALGTVVLKRGPRQSPVGANAVAALVGLPVCAAASWIAGEPHALPHTFAELFPIVYLTITGSIVAFILLAYLVNHWDVTRISFVSVIVPLVALGLGGAFRGERLNAMSLVGSALVLAGVMLRIRADRRSTGGKNHVPG